MSSPLTSSFSQRATLPYEELQELKAAAAAAASGNGFMVRALEKICIHLIRILELFDFERHNVFNFSIVHTYYVFCKQTVRVDHESINGLDSGAWKKINLPQQHAQPTCCQSSSELAQVRISHKWKNRQCSHKWKNRQC